MKLRLFILSIFVGAIVANDHHAFLEVRSSNISSLFSVPFYCKDSYGNSLNHKWSLLIPTDQVYAQMILDEIYCRQKFHMTLQQKKQMQKLSYHDFVQALLGRDDLSDADKWNLWHDYSDKRWWNWSNEKFECEIQLKEGIKKQQKKRADADRQEKEQNRQKLLKKYNQNILSNSEYISSYYQDRQKALKDTVEDGGKQYVQTYTVDAQTQAFMQMQGVDHREFENVSGTIFSHQLFQECVDHYQKAAKVVYEYGLKNSAIISYVVEFTKAAFVETEYEQFALAVKLSDLAEILSDI